jgi:hypothetical protein
MNMDKATRLAKDIPSEFISERKGLSYVTGRFVKQTLNDIFGWNGWSYQILEQRMLSIDEEAVRWLVHLRLTVNDGSIENAITRDGLAIGHGTLKDRYGKPLSPGRMNEVIDFAAAEAVTDALKRAAVSLGQALGLGLYPMTSDAEGRKTFDAPDALMDDVGGFATRIGAAESLEELRGVGRDIATADLTQPKKDILRALYMTAEKRLEKKHG